MSERRNITFVVVENSGYVGERDVVKFADALSAIRHRSAVYDADELDTGHPACLHVGIRMDWTDVDGEQSEYIA